MKKSNRTLLAEAIATQRIDDAERYFPLVLAEYGPGPKPAIMFYEEARICFLKKQKAQAIALLSEMRDVDRSPLSIVLSIKALCEYRGDMELANLLLKNLKLVLHSYVPASDDDLPKSYYEIQLKDAEVEIKGWTAGRDDDDLLSR